MKKVAVVYWSGTGNTEAMSNIYVSLDQLEKEKYNDRKKQ